MSLFILHRVVCLLIAVAAVKGKSGRHQFEESSGHQFEESSGYHLEESRGYHLEESSGRHLEESSGYHLEEFSGDHLEESSGYQFEESSGDQFEELSGELLPALNISDYGVAEIPACKKQLKCSEEFEQRGKCCWDDRCCYNKKWLSLITEDCHKCATGECCSRKYCCLENALFSIALLIWLITITSSCCCVGGCWYGYKLYQEESKPVEVPTSIPTRAYVGKELKLKHSPFVY